MRGHLFGVVVLAACFSPGLPARVPCTTDVQCPIDQRCVVDHCGYDTVDAGVTPGDDASAPDAHDADADAGVVDRCTGNPVAGPGDEDRDGVADVDDLCPLSPTPSSMDRDADCIPDDCDPNLQPPMRDHVWMFHGFRDKPDWANWPAAGDNDHLRIVAPNGMTDPDSVLGLPLSGDTGRMFDHFSAAASVTVAVAQRDDERLVGLRVKSGALQIDCTLYEEGNGRYFGLVEDLEEFDSEAVQSYAWKNNAAYTLTMIRDEGNYACTISDDSGEVTVNLTPTVPGGSPTTVGVLARGVTSTLDWVSVVGL